MLYPDLPIDRLSMQVVMQSMSAPAAEKVDALYSSNADWLLPNQPHGHITINAGATITFDCHETLSTQHHTQ
jgi:hypothetical protein